MMIIGKLRLILAILIAPAVAPLTIPLGNCALVIIGRGQNCIAGMSGYIWYGLPPAELAMLLFGLPLTLTAIRLGKTRALHFVIGGGAVGLLSAVLLGLADSSIAIAGLAAISVPTGGAASLILWALGIRGNVKVASE